MRIQLIITAVIGIMLSLAACEGDLSPQEKLEKLREMMIDKDYEKAIEYARPLLPVMPTDSVLLMLTGNAYLGLKQYDSAHSYAKKYTALYPTRMEGYHFLYVTGELVQDYDAQIWAVSQLGYLENNRQKYHYDIARLNFLRGEYGQAIKTCEMILEYNPEDSKTLFILANSMATIGKVDSAIAIMEALDRQNPNQVEVLSNLASFLVEKKDYEQAAIHFKRITSLFPDYVPGWFGLGNVLLGKGDSTAARDAYWQVYTRDSTFLGVDTIMRQLDPYLIK
jgi:tetratricopeptide (TPR) repeat protein